MSDEADFQRLVAEDSLKRKQSRNLKRIAFAFSTPTVASLLLGAEWNRMSSSMSVGAIVASAVASIGVAVIAGELYES